MIWDRIRRVLFRERAADAPPEDEPAIAPPPDPTNVAEALLQSRGEVGSPIDEAAVVRAFDALVAAGRDARAIELARRVLTHATDLDDLSRRVAEAMSSRGDDAGASEVLAPQLTRPDPSLDVLMLAAEIEERRGLDADAAGLYERVLAQSLDHPRARERAARLRTGTAPAKELAYGTLLTGGAIARGRYRVERELGRGGAGTVFAAADERLGRTIALKIYHTRGRAQRERLAHEAAIAARFEHPGVVRVLDVDEPLCALAMELVRGGSIRTELRKGAVDERRAMTWLRTCAEALAYVHDAGIVHRDLKPSNILLRDDDRAVLTDFGVAGVVREDGSPSTGEGTLGYMAPEQRRGDKPHPSADLYALGVTMRELVDAWAPLHARLGPLIARCIDPEQRARPTALEIVVELS